jgi:hypothetical protein
MSDIRLKKCERCPALIRLNAMRCKPCQDDVRREAHRIHEKNRKARVRATITA